jgi:hypothetical protein
MADKTPFLADQLAFYQTHTAKLAELQAARGRGPVDPASFMPSSAMFDELMGAFKTSVSSSAPANSSTPTGSSGYASPAGGSSSSNSPTSSENLRNSSSDSDSSDPGDWGIAIGSALSNNPGAILGGLASVAQGNIPSALRAAFTVGADTVAAYRAISSLREPTVGENAGQTPTADLAAMAALGDKDAEAASNYDSRVQQSQQPSFSPVYGDKTFAPGTSPTGYNANSVTLTGQLLGYKNSVTGEVVQQNPSSSSSSSSSNPYDSYFSNPNADPSGYVTYGTSEGE